MAENLTEQSRSWREELKQLGKQYFEIQDMLRLGFLKLSQEELNLMKEKLKELNKVSAEIRKLSKEVEGMEDITPIIKEIRKNRIERVRAERAIHKVEKAKERTKRQAEIEEKKKNTPTFLGNKIASALKYDNFDEEKLKTQNLPSIKNIATLAEATRLTREEIIWLAYHRQTATIDHYTRFQIPKRKGGFRTISTPKPKMRQVQGWILENILNKVDIHVQAMAFVAGKSIVDNAQTHLGQKLILRIDLKDFFPSIKFPRVKGLFRSLGYSDGVATVFALLCTDSMRLSATLEGKRYYVGLGERFLPQGASTSPMLSNIICRKLDNRLYKLAQSLNWTYSRYADDLVFSFTDAQSDTLRSLLGLTKKIIAEESFEINKDKTMFMRPHQRQSVTGIVVNDGKMRISRRDARNFRAFLHQFEEKGEEEMSKKLGKNARQYGRGYLAFLHMVSPEQAEKFSQKYAWLVT